MNKDVRLWNFVVLSVIIVHVGIVTVPAQAAEPRGTMILVVGAPGTDEFATTFADWADRWREVAASGNLTLVDLAAAPAEMPTTHDRLHRALLDAASEPSQPLWLVLIGHGTFDGRLAKLNLVGTDVSTEDLQAWCAPLQRPLAVTIIGGLTLTTALTLFYTPLFYMLAHKLRREDAEARP